MRKLLLISSLMLCSGFALGQPASAPQALPVREITGQVRLGGRPAPAGVVVSLRVVFNRDLIEADQEESVRTSTDVSGKFVFHHLENLGNGGKDMFAVSTIYQGFMAGQQLVDLSENLRSDVVLDLQRISNTLAAPRAARDSAAVIAPATDGEPAPRRRPRSPQAQAAVDRAQELLFRKHDPDASIAEFKKAVKLDPWYGPGYVLMGLAYTQMRRWDSAQLAFEEAIKVEPSNAQAFLGLGSSLNEQHDYPAAQKALEESLKLKPESAEAHYELARALCSLGKWQAAQPHAQQAIAINPDYAGPHALMGNIYVQAEDAEGALNEFRAYLRLAPEGDLAPQAKEMVQQLEKVLVEDAGKDR